MYRNPIALRRFILLAALMQLAISSTLPAIEINPENETSPPAPSVTPAQFQSLDDLGRWAILEAVLQHRLKATQNVSLNSVTRVYNVEFANGKPGVVIPDKDWGRWECELKRSGQNYWTNTKWFKIVDQEKPTAHSIGVFDSIKGEFRGLAGHQQMNESWGCISSAHDRMYQMAKINYWFDIHFDKNFTEYPLGFMLSNIDKTEFGEFYLTHGTVELLIKDASHVVTNFREDRRVVCDINKGFLPVSITRTIRDTKSKSDRPFEIRYFSLQESKEIGGLWFPWKTREYSEGEPVWSEGYTTIFESTVKDLKLGNVKSVDLTLEFPPDVKVHDRIRKVWLLNGKMIENVIPLNK